MRGSSFSYLVKHGMQSLWLNRLMSFASIGILCACLIITGGAGLIGLGVSQVFSEVEGQNEITVFIKDEADQEAAAALKNKILAIEGVEEATYTSREQAFQNEKDKLGNDSQLFDGLDPSEVFPASYTVKLKNSSFMKSVVSAIEKLENVEKVGAMVTVADTFSKLRNTLLIIGSLLAAILIVVSVIVISNAIRLTVFARRREINIMKYVGATNRFIRLPFKVEAFVIGLSAAVLSFFALWGLYSLVGGMFADSQIAIFSNLSLSVNGFSILWPYLLGYNIIFGIAIAEAACLASMGKYLKV